MSGVLILVIGAVVKGITVLALVGGGLLAGALAVAIALGLAALGVLLGVAAGAIGLLLAVGLVLGIATLPLAVPVLLVYLLWRARPVGAARPAPGPR